MDLRKLATIAMTALLLALALPAGVLAESGAQRIRGGLAYAVPTDDRTDGATTTELDEVVGLQVSYERFVADKVGLEIGVGAFSHDITISESGFPDQAGEIDLNTLTINLNVHLLDEGKVDFYIGPTVGYTFWGDLKLDVFPQDFATDDDFLYGANLGFDVPIGDGNWGFAGGLTYLFSEVSLEGGSDIGVDPVQLKAGFVYRF